MLFLTLQVCFVLTQNPCFGDWCPLEESRTDDLVFSGEISNVCPLNCSSAATLGSWGLLVPGYSVPQWPPGVNSSVWWEGLGQAHLQVVVNVEQFEQVVVNVTI